MMRSGNSTIIHPSPIIQLGLKSILLSRNIRILEILNSLPNADAITNWRNMLIFMDISYSSELRQYSKILKKNGNTIVAITTNEADNKMDSLFGEKINIHDSSALILQKINPFLGTPSESKADNQLSAREIEILTLVAKGFSNKQIADKFYISIHTVITHRKNITFKLGIKSIPGLTLYAALNNLVDSHQ